MPNKNSVFRELLNSDEVTRIVGVNDSIGGLLAERRGFDALWASGLGISTAWGVPDASILTMTEMLQSASVVNRTCGLPVISDCDTGFGDINNARRMVREYEAAGISAVCIEDKEYPKRNSFRDGHRLADRYEFAARIAMVKEASEDPDFTVIARLESLIAGVGVDDAFDRACRYTAAGADAILVHSKAKTADQVTEFAELWRSRGGRVPVLVVPTTYPDITIDELKNAGISGVIYANQTLRASIHAMDEALNSIQKNGTSLPIEPEISSVHEVFELTRTAEIEITESWFNKKVMELRGAESPGTGRASFAEAIQ
ncbi:phosphoenolpyruvate phosphomutase [Streptomonospora sp. PA3]|uniref:isocitrate lyase/phosphoenolpyruvate mutase family protein n=1 Tax=Streptomonospora sp. PA3 TaxID=2607326 RepID=UPI0012DCBA3C|nr:isocitrate lyase/phosphoenolpyruvate mutase family protein [Streptomonospora sp. PA3]MUL43190.1 phosphoenolpyruvate phosphomutase [Streptomonospora sp. PA3]